MLQLIRLFQDLEYRVTFCSTAQRSDRSFDLTSIGVEVASVELNKPSFDQFINDLDPDVVMFDRFITEEQFGWRVAEQVPQAIRILDAEDFHGLRKARELAFKEGVPLEKAHLHNEVTKRELVAMYRVDLTLVISEAELQLFSKEFHFPSTALLYLPFVIEKGAIENIVNPGYNERSHFVTVGNYLHRPNADALHFLKKEIWPLIRRDLPKAELHVYGAYQSKAKQLHNEKEGFLVKGAVPDIYKILPGYRVCLAPLRFGAGLKGKIFDAMYTGTPSVMSTIAAEGLFGTMEPAGFIEDNAVSFANKSRKLYTDPYLWQGFRENAQNVLKVRFKRAEYLTDLQEVLQMLHKDLPKHRQQHFTGQLFLQQSLLSSRYLSKWIEAKNK